MAAKLAVISRRAFLSTSVLALLPSVAWPASPKQGGTFIMALGGEPATASAHLTTDTDTFMVATNLFSSLITLDYDFNPVPELAEKWSISPDGLTYTFNLVKNANWHDGKPLTAADVEYTFNEVLAKVHPRASSWWPTVATAKATDSYTFVVTLKEPYAPFMTVLGNTLGSGALILPKHIYQGTDPRTNSANQHPIGSGAFKFSKWEKGSYIELVRNDDYFRKGLPYLDRVIAQFMPDSASRLLAFERGEVDFINWYIVPYDQVARLRKDTRFKVIDKGGEGAATNEYVLFNLRNEKLKDVRVRQAIAYTVDREQIKAKALFGEGKVAHSFINSGIKWVYEDKNDVYVRPNVAKANALLDEAGFKRDAGGKRFDLRLAWASGREYEGRAAEIIRDNLRAVGINVKVETMDRSTYIDKVFRNWDFDMANQLFTTGPDPTISLTPRYHTKQIKKAPFVNAMGYSNPKLDAIFDAEVHVADRAKRAELWREAQRILMADLPALPIFEVPVVNLASAKFNNVITGPDGYYESRTTTYQI